MMGRGVKFREVVRLVGGAGAPIYMELALFNAILDPVETHVHRFGFSLFESVVGKPAGGGVVNLGWGCWLRMPHFF